jgi:hypothetical protein
MASAMRGPRLSDYDKSNPAYDNSKPAAKEVALYIDCVSQGVTCQVS